MKSESSSIQRALIVYVEFKNSKDDDEYNEFYHLVKSTGLEIVGSITTTRSHAEPRFFVGKGKVDEIRKTAIFLSGYPRCHHHGHVVQY